jgi:serine/threonine protein kinase
LIIKDPLFQGKTEGDQLFAIFSTIGSPTEAEYDELAKKVPFDPKLFKEFPTVPKSAENKEKFTKLFYIIKDRQNLLDLLNRMFTYLPEERITAKEAIAHPFFDAVRNHYSCMQLH